MTSTTCPHCGVYSNLSFRWGNVTRLNFSYVLDTAYTCDSCRRVVSTRIPVKQDRGTSVAYMQEVQVADSTSDVSWEPPLLRVPELEGVPEQIAGAAAEAYRSLGVHNYRASALMARAVIEACAKDHGVTKGTLAAKIDKLHENGDLTKYISEFAHTIRDLGNDAAHSDFVRPLDAETAEGLLSLMYAVLESLYKHRAQHQKLRERMI